MAGSCALTRSVWKAATLLQTRTATHEGRFMNEQLSVWPTLFLLGAYHGINPGMGWLFAVARGMQEHATNAVTRALIPITLGHALSIGVVVALAGLIQIVLPLGYVQLVVAFALIGLGVFRILRRKHFAWGGMQVGFRDLTVWSFLMASAHGAGLMVLPVVFATPMPAGHEHHMHMAGADLRTGL